MAARLRELQKSAAIPPELQQQKSQLEQRRQQLDNYLADHRTAIKTEMESLIRDLKKRYLDIAGEGQMGRARMMRELAVASP